jgi:hypothetical protein
MRGKLAFAAGRSTVVWEKAMADLSILTAVVKPAIYFWWIGNSVFFATCSDQILVEILSVLCRK